MQGDHKFQQSLGSPSRILIAEDDSSMAIVLRQMLQNFGYVVCGTVASGEKALTHSRKEHPDLILMDVLLEGDLDGIAAAEKIDEELAIPIIYLTAYSDNQTLQRAKITHPSAFLLKPFDQEQLHAAIEMALAGPKKDLRLSWPAEILRSVADAILCTDEQGKVTFMNPSAEVLTGWSFEEAGKKIWTDILKIENATAGSFDSSVASGLRDHASLISRNGKKISIDYSTAQFRDQNGKGNGFVFVFHDDTDRTRLEEAVAESRKRYKELVNSIDGIVWESDNTHRFTFVSKEAQRLLGYSVDRWLFEPSFWREHLHPGDRDWAMSFSEKAAKGSMDYEMEYRMLASDGRTIWIRDILNVVVESNQPVKMRGVMIDITETKRMESALRKTHAELDHRVHERTAELSKAVANLKKEVADRKRAEEALRQSEERYALAALGANDGLWDWNIRQEQVYYSLRWKSMLGMQDDEIGQSPNEWFSRVHPQDLDRVKMEIDAHLADHSPHFKNEHRMRHKDGTYRWMLTRGVAQKDSAGAYRMAGSQTDITERKKVEEQLIHDAFHDALTNLSNRALFIDRLSGASARAASRARRGGRYIFAVLFLDLDRFKVVNDSLGHITGDQLLIGIARRLEKCLRPGDTIARLGGDEFAILIEDMISLQDATIVAERILYELRLPFNLNGKEVFTSASIGIALSTRGSPGAEDLLRDADTAMYKAKSAGKSRYEVFDPSMHGSAVALLQLETDIRRAIERDEFLIYYQPIVQLQTREVAGFEALVRWQHPDRGLLSPMELIPVAEETGLIVPIGNWVLEEACRQLHLWHQRFRLHKPLTVSVNLSARQFSQPDLTERISRILQKTGLSSDSLRLEITESVIMENADVAVSLLQQLRALEVRLLIDDFGTGYSSLSYLQKFPINTLKIDRSFVSKDTENWEIVKTIITLASNLGMDVVAEGVETEQQREQLLRLGCEFGQGFLFSVPLSTETATEMIAGMA